MFKKKKRAKNFKHDSVVNTKIQKYLAHGTLISPFYFFLAICFIYCVYTRVLSSVFICFPAEIIFRSTAVIGACPVATD